MVERQDVDLVGGEEGLVKNLEVEPEEKIFSVAIDRDNLDWKNFLYQLIHDEGLDPWDVDLAILTNRYLQVVRELSSVDFDVTGKFLTVAVFLLKMKAENLVEKDLRGIDEQIALINESDVSDDFFGEWETLEELDVHLNDLYRKRKREKYEIKVRNPIARKRKVNIFDLVSLLEKTFKQSNKRKANLLQKQEFEDDFGYDGPMYDENPMDLATIIDNLHDLILGELNETDSHVFFSKFVQKEDSTLEFLEKFMPLLYLHNQNKVYLNQENHFGDIEIHHRDRAEKFYEYGGLELEENLKK